MRSQLSQQRYNKPGDDSSGFSFQNMMGMKMRMLQQQNDHQERMQQEAQLDHEIYAQQAEQMRLEHEERAEEEHHGGGKIYLLDL
jgi:hypothetical protein